jgi:alpha-mannosidase
VSAREVDGQERPVGPAKVEKGQLVFDTAAYHPRAFAVTLARAASPLTAPVSQSIALHTGGDEPKAVNEANRDFDGHGNSLPDEMLPARLEDGGVTFSVKSRESLNAVVCQGQTLNLPAGKGRRVYLLAAASGGDAPADFRVGDKAVSLTIQSGDGYVGQWDTRQWEGQLPESTYDWHNAYAGLTPGYIKTAQVAWYADHKCLANGEADPYAFCYLYKYAIAVPDDARTLTLPTDPKIRLFAATVSQNPNDDATLATPLIDPIKS